jgi:hypothetical protein
MSPKSAYPTGYKLGKDNQSWLMRQKNKVQVWFTGGPRVPSGFWKFRELPRTLILLSGNGDLRYENTDGTVITCLCKTKAGVLFNMEPTACYLSRIQPWTRFHFALMWPLAIHWSLIWRSRDVVKYPKYQSVFGIKKMFAGYLGWVRDSDKIYKPKFFVGGNFE